MPASYEQRAAKRGILGKKIQYKKIFQCQPGEAPNRWDKRIARAKERAREMLDNGTPPARVIAYFESASYAREVEDEIVKNLSIGLAKRVMSLHVREVVDQYKAYIQSRKELHREAKRARMAELAARRRARRLKAGILRERARLKRVSERNARRKLKQKIHRKQVKIAMRATALRRRAEARARQRAKRKQAAVLRRQKLALLRREARKRQRLRKIEQRRQRALIRAQRRRLRARREKERAKLRKRERRAKRRYEASKKLVAIREQKRHLASLGRRMRRWLYAQRELVVVEIKSRLYQREQDVISLARAKGITRKKARRKIIEGIVAGSIDNCTRLE